MRILSWNINGIKTLPKYHPWNTFKTCEGILDEIKADVICFQEMKSSRNALPRDVALPGPYHSFFSFPANKGGYSGVAVYVDSRKVTPLKAEEGLSGQLQPDPSLSAEERISPSYPFPHHIDLYADEDGNVPSSFDVLDSEGRGLVLDFGLFVLINVYCPNETSDARLSFKMNYHLMLEERVRKLVEEEQREVMVVGDINVCAAPVDHCDGHLPSNSATFYDPPARAWFHKWIGPGGPMTDIIRQFHPDRKGLFTCWNMKLQARETNYGTRIDYVLVTKGLLPCISGGDIQASLKGSDHCPIYVDLHDQIILESGETIALCDAMKQSPDLKDPPRIAAKYWDEFSGKQTVLSAFFSKGPVVKNGDTPLSDTPTPTPTPAPTEAMTTPARTATSSSPEIERVPTPPADPPPAKKFKPSQPRQPSQSNQSTKRKTVETPSSSKKRKSAPAKGQSSIASFFSKPSASASTSASASASSSAQKAQEVIDVDGDDGDAGAVPTAPDEPMPGISASHSECTTEASTEDQLDADYRLALALAASPSESSSSSQPSGTSSASTAAAWSNLFAPVEAPRCAVHDEPARLYTVNKQGPNKGKTFYLCARPVGPGWDKGRQERLREEVDHRYRCNFFRWASEVRREAMRGRERAANGGGNGNGNEDGSGSGSGKGRT
ncbi:transcription factor [Ganoderma sinense ZZ0214-1]|uniref:DNA-(apurinic or apyrimidinic site) endonuclease n=1 Tax=Ganoderma sinense ZZ0214-1 TaxID=1077348 RepID=A0A2G8RUN0_9APHY|nr:transcription factor [Ganoderma sinense ZZ0214-1]